MITEKLYYNNSYIKKFSANVLSCEEKKDGFYVVLDKTAFFPEGGGQKADAGCIGDAAVKDVREKNGVIYHLTDKLLNIGETYGCTIDWDVRFRRMQQHSGEHVVSGIVHSLFGYDNVGFHMEDDYVTVDFSGELNRQQLDEVEEKANEAIYSNLEIKCWFPDEDELDKLDYRSKLDLTENVRLVDIESVDLCACCAPHLNRTGEIGVIKILDFMRHRGGIRIIIKSGLDALYDYRAKYKSVYDISGLLSAKQNEVSGAVERLQNELDALRREFYNFKISVSENDKNNILFAGDCSYFFGELYDADMMRELVNYGMTKSTVCFGFFGNSDDGYSYIIGSNFLDMKKVAKAVNSALNGRGGGRDTMIQGKVFADKVKITEFINNLETGEL